MKTKIWIGGCEATTRMMRMPEKKQSSVDAIELVIRIFGRWRSAELLLSEYRLIQPPNLQLVTQSIIWSSCSRSMRATNISLQAACNQTELKTRCRRREKNTNLFSLSFLFLTSQGNLLRRLRKVRAPWRSDEAVTRSTYYSSGDGWMGGWIRGFGICWFLLRLFARSVLCIQGGWTTGD